MRRVVAVFLLACAVGCGSDGTDALADFCREAYRYDVLSREPPDYTAPAKVREYLRITLRTARRLRALAPADISPDVDVVVAQLERQDAGLAKAGYDVKKVEPGDTTVDPAVQTSGRKLAAYLRDNCDFQTPEPT